jgi:hypothetical protein
MKIACIDALSHLKSATAGIPLLLANPKKAENTKIRINISREKSTDKFQCWKSTDSKFRPFQYSLPFQYCDTFVNIWNRWIFKIGLISEILTLTLTIGISSTFLVLTEKPAFYGFLLIYMIFPY